MSAAVAHPDALGAGAPDRLAALAFVVERAHAEIHAALATLRQSRVEIQAGAVEPLQRTSAKLHEVSAATETAATDLLDALDRAQAMVDALDAADDENDRASARTTRARLRDELFGMVGALQFQDITSQQLAGAAHVLGVLEARLRGVAELFEPAVALGGAAERWGADARMFDANATTRNAQERQAAADAIFAAGD